MLNCCIGEGAIACINSHAKANKRERRERGAMQEAAYTPLKPQCDIQQVRVNENGCILIDDALLTLVMLLGAVQDLTYGVLRLGYPTWTLIHISAFNVSELSDPIVRLTRVSGYGNLEAGILGLILVAWRLYMWYRSLPFRGQNFQFGFALTAISKTGAFLTNAALSEWQPVAPGAPLDNSILFARAVVAFCAFILSLFTYRDSWTALLRRSRL